MTINLKTQKILVVEDFSIMRKAIKEMLFRAEARNVAEAENANVALDQMAKEKFDIILCDYNLGTGKNGQQMLEEAKYRKLLPANALFIMVTAEQTQSMVLSAMDNKPDDYLTKPFNSQQLLGRIEKHFNRKQFFAEIELAIEKNNIPQAIVLCENLLAQKDPRTLSPLQKIRAELAIKAGDLQTAAYYYQEVLNQRELVWARMGLGVVAFHQHDIDLGIMHFQKVLSAAPMMMETYDWLAKAYELQGKHAEAQEILLKAVELSPQAILRQQKLANLADKSENLDVARVAYKSAIKLGEHSVHKSSGDFSGLAKVYCKNNDPKEAVKVIAALRKEFQNDPEAELRALTQEVAIFKAQNNPDLSAETYAHLAELSAKVEHLPKDLALDIAKTHQLNGNLEAAQELIDKLIINNIDDEFFINDVRSMNKTLGHEDQTEILIERAKKELIDINNQGVNLFKQGKIAEALDYLSNAAEKMPTNKTIILNMATILIQDMKRNGLTKEKLLKSNDCIKKATNLGASYDRLTHIRMEFAKLTEARNLNS